MYMVGHNDKFVHSHRFKMCCNLPPGLFSIFSNSIQQYCSICDIPEMAKPILAANRNEIGAISVIIIPKTNMFVFVVHLDRKFPKICLNRSSAFRLSFHAVFKSASASSTEGRLSSMIFSTYSGMFRLKSFSSKSALEATFT